jgi:MFS family permease
MAFGGLSLFGIREGAYGGGEEQEHVRDWHDFVIVFVARSLVFFGLTLLQTFVLFFFRDVQKVSNPSAGTALYAFATIGEAVLSSVVLGVLSDRAPRKIVTALAGASMAVSTIGFALAPEMRWVLPFAVLFGIGFGGVLSSGWALAMDAVPKLRDVGRSLGLWGIATSVPNVIAPLAGGWLIGLFHGTRGGYQAVFGLSGLSFALASLSPYAHRAASDLVALGGSASCNGRHVELCVGPLSVPCSSLGPDSATARRRGHRRQSSTRLRVAGDRRDYDG